VVGALFLNAGRVLILQINALMEDIVHLINLYMLQLAIILCIAEQMKMFLASLPPLVIPRLAPHVHLQQIRADRQIGALSSKIVLVMRPHHQTAGVVADQWDRGAILGQTHVGKPITERFNVMDRVAHLPRQTVRVVADPWVSHVLWQIRADRSDMAQFSVMDHVVRRRHRKADVRYSQLQYTNPQHVL